MFPRRSVLLHSWSGGGGGGGRKGGGGMEDFSVARIFLPL